MTNAFGAIFPLLPGKRRALAELAAALQGPRRAEYEAAQTTVLKESWFLKRISPELKRWKRRS